MKFITKCALLLMPALALATPAFAFGPALLSDSEQPGSVVIYPKIINELFGPTGAPIIVDGQTVSQTEIEIGAVCPFALVTAGGFCANHQPIIVRFHWVCPGDPTKTSDFCQESNFEVDLTVNGKLAFSANGNAINLNSPPLVPAAPCARGYLIGWVVNTNGQPVKFNGLIGNAVIRGGNLPAGTAAGSSTAVSAYSAVTIQTDPTIPGPDNGTVVIPASPNPTSPLVFGVPNVGGYTTVSPVQIGDVRFDKTVAGVPLPNVLSRTFLTLLTLDVNSNALNPFTNVNLDFYNESQIQPGNVNAFEHLTSTSTHFICWNQVPLANLAGGALTQAFQGTRKGIVIAGPATQAGGTGGQATLIGLVETLEGTVANGFLERKYNFNMDTNGIPQPTAFVPLPAFP
jgi:hypothetical protein